MAGPAIVIAGAGHAGVEAAGALRQSGFCGRITLLGDEQQLPYQRPPMSKSFLQGFGDEIALRPASFYADHHIDIRLGTSIAGINRSRAHAELADGTAIAYDHLILATGARSRKLDVPGAQATGIAYLRTLADAIALKRAAANAVDIAIVGAGFIGLEIAMGLAKAGARVTVVEAQDAPLGRTVSARTARWLAERLAAQGIAILTGAKVAAFESEAGRLAAVLLADGRQLPAELAVIGIGAAPNAEFALAAGPDVAGGIVTDAHHLTADPAISAIGDCAAVRAADGTLARLESLPSAIAQAHRTAARLAGATRPMRSEAPWFWSDIGHCKLRVAGVTSLADVVVPVSTETPDNYAALCFRHGRFLGAETVNANKLHLAARKTLEHQLPLDIDQSRASGFDLFSFARASQRSSLTT
jgi:3-phenylpropionate/trans-cinnamate dioxygenase ferredoxin reductase component